MSNLSGRRTIIRNDFTPRSSNKTSQGGAVQSQPAPTVTKSRKRRSSKERIKSSTVAIYASVFALLVSVVALGYKAPEEVTAIASASGWPVGAAPAPQAAVVNLSKLATGNISSADVLAANIAASVANNAELSVAGHINEMAASAEIQSQYAAADETSSVSKPVIVELSAASRDIQSYTVIEGDTLESIAQRFGISVNTLKWSNNISVNSVSAGKVLEILPKDGIVYTVKAGDDINKIAEKYKADASLIATYNDLEISGVSEGLKIIIPDGDLPETERPGYVPPRPSYSSGSYIGFISGYGNWSGEVLGTYHLATPAGSTGGYAAGNCTAYAFMRRAELGKPLPPGVGSTNFGNAISWPSRASSLGFSVNRSPSVGAVIQSGNHVGVVEEIRSDGSLRVTDMNYMYRLNNVANRIIPASHVGAYMYIH